MWLQVNKETKRIQGYIEFCLDTPIAEDGCELVEVDEIPSDWEYSKFENGATILDELFKAAKLVEKTLSEIRIQREIECFPIVNRGILWYNTLTDSKKEELNNWYKAWLDAPATKIIPSKPTWLE